MTKLIPCELCNKIAEYTIQPDGGSITYWCNKHYHDTIKELEG